MSRTLSISAESISSQEIAIIHLLSTTSNDEELNDRNAQLICSPAIFSASSRDLSKFALNSSMSKIFHFLIAFD
jgi:poly-D-alanine transfer protein DltD